MATDTEYATTWTLRLKTSAKRSAWVLALPGGGTKSESVRPLSDPEWAKASLITHARDRLLRIAANRRGPCRLVVHEIAGGTTEHVWSAEEGRSYIEDMRQLGRDMTAVCEADRRERLERSRG